MQLLRNSFWFATGALITSIAVRLDHPECTTLTPEIIFPIVLLCLQGVFGVLLYGPLNRMADGAGDEVREKLAEFVHLIRGKGWAESVFGKGLINVDGSWTMPKWAFDRLMKKAETPYAEMTDDERESDRAEADKIIALFGGEAAQKQ